MAKSATSRASKPLRQGLHPQSRLHPRLRRVKRRAAQAGQGPATSLPEWNLADLYPGIDAPEIDRDLDRIDADCIAFEQDYKGKLAEETAKAGRRRLARRGGEALRGDRRSARPARLLCRAGARRQQRRSGDREVLRRRSGAPDRGVGASAVLRARTQPHRRRRDRARRCRRRSSATIGRGSRTCRKDKPYQLEDRVEQLFHEKSVTGYSRLEPAVRRDHRRPALQGRRQGAGDRADAEPAAGSRCRPSARPPAQALAKTFKANERTFALITNTLAKDKEISDRWRGFEDVADSRHLSNRVEREVVDALVAVGARRLSAAVASLLRAEGALVRQEAAGALGSQRAAAVRRRPAPSAGPRRRTWC